MKLLYVLTCQFLVIIFQSHPKHTCQLGPEQAVDRNTDFRRVQVDGSLRLVDEPHVNLACQSSFVSSARRAAPL